MYHETIKFLGYKEKDKYYDENGLFFKMLLNFFKEIDKQKPKLEIKRMVGPQRDMGKKVNQGALMEKLNLKLKQKVHNK